MTGECANCGADFKTGMLSSNAPLTEQDIELINLAHDSGLQAACQKCCSNLRDTAPFKIAQMVKAKSGLAESLLSCIPIASIQSPQGWNYKTLGLVTAQTVSGTGLFSDVTSAFTDLFGAQSGAYNQKLRAAENMCRASLRAQAFQMGGNAVLGIDVDYAEVGGQRAMLMVCMTGTAVALSDTAVAGETFAQQFAELQRETAALRDLRTIAKRLYVAVE